MKCRVASGIESHGLKCISRIRVRVEKDFDFFNKIDFEQYLVKAHQSTLFVKYVSVPAYPYFILTNWQLVHW